MEQTTHSRVWVAEAQVETLQGAEALRGLLALSSTVRLPLGDVPVALRVTTMAGACAIDLLSGAQGGVTGLRVSAEGDIVALLGADRLALRMAVDAALTSAPPMVLRNAAGDGVEWRESDRTFRVEFVDATSQCVRLEFGSIDTSCPGSAAHALMRGFFGCVGRIPHPLADALDRVTRHGLPRSVTVSWATVAHSVAAFRLVVSTVEGRPGEPGMLEPPREWPVIDAERPGKGVVLPAMERQVVSGAPFAVTIPAPAGPGRNDGDPSRTLANEVLWPNLGDGLVDVIGQGADLALRVDQRLLSDARTVLNDLLHPLSGAFVLIEPYAASLNVIKTAGRWDRRRRPGVPAPTAETVFTDIVPLPSDVGDHPDVAVLYGLLHEEEPKELTSPDGVGRGIIDRLSLSPARAAWNEGAFARQLVLSAIRGSLSPQQSLEFDALASSPTPFDALRWELRMAWVRGVAQELRAKLRVDIPFVSTTLPGLGAPWGSVWMDGLTGGITLPAATTRSISAGGTPAFAPTAAIVNTAACRADGSIEVTLDLGQFAASAQLHLWVDATVRRALVAGSLGALLVPGGLFVAAELASLIAFVESGPASVRIQSDTGPMSEEAGDGHFLATVNAWWEPNEQRDAFVPKLLLRLDANLSIQVHSAWPFPPRFVALLLMHLETMLLAAADAAGLRAGATLPDPLHRLVSFPGAAAATVSRIASWTRRGTDNGHVLTLGTLERRAALPQQAAARDLDALIDTELRTTPPWPRNYVTMAVSVNAINEMAVSLARRGEWSFELDPSVVPVLQAAAVSPFASGRIASAEVVCTRAPRVIFAPVPPAGSNVAQASASFAIRLFQPQRSYPARVVVDVLHFDVDASVQLVPGTRVNANPFLTILGLRGNWAEMYWDLETLRCLNLRAEREVTDGVVLERGDVLDVLAAARAQPVTVRTPLSISSALSPQLGVMATVAFSSIVWNRVSHIVPRAARHPLAPPGTAGVRPAAMLVTGLPDGSRYPAGTTGGGIPTFVPVDLAVRANVWMAHLGLDGTPVRDFVATNAMYLGNLPLARAPYYLAFKQGMADLLRGLLG